MLRVRNIWLPITSWPELCEGCGFYYENDEVDRECGLQNLCFDIEKLEVSHE